MKVLIVDDSKFIREFMKQNLHAMEIECAEAQDGAEALGILRNGERFDLMLVDVNMPGMGGLECVLQLRGEDLAPEMKVMMVTTEADFSFMEQAFLNGADEFLMKPFTRESLREKLMLLGLAMAA